MKNKIIYMALFVAALFTSLSAVATDSFQAGSCKVTSYTISDEGIPIEKEIDSFELSKLNGEFDVVGYGRSADNNYIAKTSVSNVITIYTRSGDSVSRSKVSSLGGDTDENKKMVEVEMLLDNSDKNANESEVVTCKFHFLL